MGLSTSRERGYDGHCTVSVVTLFRLVGCHQRRRMTCHDVFLRKPCSMRPKLSGLVLVFWRRSAAVAGLGCCHLGIWMKSSANSVMNFLWRWAPNKSEEQEGALRTGQPADRKMPQDGLVPACGVSHSAALRTCAMSRSDL